MVVKENTDRKQKTYVFLNFVERSVWLKWKKKVNVIKTIIIEWTLFNMPEYAWMRLYKQDSEYTSGPKYDKILNIAKFWIWQGSQCASVTQRSGYARMCLDRVLNIYWVLNMLGF